MSCNPTVNSFSTPNLSIVVDDFESLLKMHSTTNNKKNIQNSPHKPKGGTQIIAITGTSAATTGMPSGTTSPSPNFLNHTAMPGNLQKMKEYELYKSMIGAHATQSKNSLNK